MKRIQIHIVLLLLFLPFVSWAQLDSAGRAQIREVQQNYGLYFRGDATASTAAKAMERAERALWQEVEQYADTAKATVVNTSAVTDKMQKVTVARGDQFRIIVTNLDQKSVVFGGEQKLRESVKKAVERYNPKLIFVYASCASGIIGDDIDSICSDLSAEYPDQTIIPIHCEGFKSRPIFFKCANCPQEFARH